MGIVMIGIMTAIFAFLTAAAIMPASIAFSKKIGAVDIPADNRRMHSKATPTSGGLAIAVAVFLSVCLFSPDAAEYRVYFIGGSAVALLGLADDIRTLHPLPKLLLQTAAAVSCAVYLSGGMLGTHGINTVFLRTLWIVLVMNAVNIIDGIDGLCGGTCCVIAAALALLTANPVIFALCGACGGFLLFNKPPARVFLGDCGSLFLGFTLAVASLGLFNERNGILLVPALFFLPVADIVFAFFRRLAHGKNPFAADRLHLHHRLCYGGMSVPEADLVLILFALICALSSYAGFSGDTRRAAVIFFSGLLFISSAVYLSVYGGAGENTTATVRTDGNDLTEKKEL